MLFRSVINTNSFYEHLSTSERERLKKCVTVTRYGKGQVIFYEEAMPFGVFMVNGGHIKLYKTGDQGKKQIFQIGCQGDLFGFHAVLLNEPYPDSAETLEACELSFLPKADFIDLIMNSSRLSFFLLQRLSEEFRDFIDQETMLSQKPVRERIAAVLVNLHEIYKGSTGKGIIPLSRGDLADLSGTVKETLVRTLREFKDEKLIVSETGRDIHVKALARLRQIAGL